MRTVPLNKVLLQPRVHFQWLQRHGALCFEVGPLIAQRFATLWQQYQAEQCPSPTQFLEYHSLAEDDYLFALFAGAVYLRTQVAGFCVEMETDAVIWRGEPSETLLQSNENKPNQDWTA